MSILSPKESVAFQSFLSSIDVDGFHGPTPTEWLLYHQGNPDASDSLHPKAKDALKKATMDLMSLDSSSASSTHHIHAPSWPNFPTPDPFPQPKQVFRYPMGRDEHPRTLKHPSSSNTPSPPPTRPSLITPAASSSSSSSSKRSFDKLSSGSSKQPTSKRRRSSPAPPSPPSASRPALLSASQKRANHIQSEQKRRANIRRGYEALCETVPALREAIRKEEEEAAALGGVPANNIPPSKGAAAPRKKRSKAAVEDDKIDGRAGPKSENVVLQKTIDYIQDLNAAKESLMQRLANARARLPQTHTSQTPQGEPIWEREWTGGTGSAGGDDDEGSDDES